MRAEDKKLKESQLSNHSRLSHDFHAQLINLKGFCGEIQQTANDMASLRENAGSDLDAEFSNNLEKLINHDLYPCIKYLALSTNKLEEVATKIFSAPQGKGEEL